MFSFSSNGIIWQLSIAHCFFFFCFFFFCFCCCNKVLSLRQKGIRPKSSRSMPQAKNVCVKSLGLAFDLNQCICYSQCYFLKELPSTAFIDGLKYNNLSLLRKNTYSYMLKISPTKTESFQMKILIVFIFLLKT